MASSSVLRQQVGKNQSEKQGKQGSPLKQEPADDTKVRQDQPNMMDQASDQKGKQGGGQKKDVDHSIDQAHPRQGGYS